jgi:hypothetical protein
MKLHTQNGKDAHQKIKANACASMLQIVEDRLPDARTQGQLNAGKSGLAAMLGDSSSKQLWVFEKIHLITVKTAKIAAMNHSRQHFPMLQALFTVITGNSASIG